MAIRDKDPEVGPADGETPAERRRERLRLHIISEAAKLYRANGGANGGYEQTTVEAIAASSDISLRSFFRYFESKADVIFLDVRRSVLDLEKILQSRLRVDPPLRAIFNARVDQLNYFLASKIGKERLQRSLKAPQFQDRLLVMRAETKRVIAECVLPYLDGEAEERNQKSLMIASVFTDAFAHALDMWLEHPEVDFSDHATRSLQFLPGLVEDLRAQMAGVVER